MRLLASCISSLLLLSTALRAAEPGASTLSDTPSLIIVVGVAGAEEYGESFLRQATTWQENAARAGIEAKLIGTSEGPEHPDREALRLALEAEPRESASPLWLVLIGHGTFDGREAKFNVRGDDFSATELSDWLRTIRRPMALMNTASASAPFMAKLAGEGRVIVTSTRSGYEQNYARFGIYFAEAFSGLDGDLDKDGETSLLEAFLMGSGNLAEWYRTENRLATEHPLIDDNGDGMGTPPDWFRGIRAVRRPANGGSVDGVRAHQLTLVRSEAERQLSPEIRMRRDAIERQIASLRDRKANVPSDEYYRLLEQYMLELAALYFEGT